MKTAMAIRHLDFEDLGTLEALLASRGYAVRYLDATIDDLRSVDTTATDLLVVLGGPIGAFDDAIYPFIGDELAVILQRLDSQRPLLGICLGAQLIARALGAGVASMGVKEIGFAPLTLTPDGEASPLAALGRVPVLHWHGDTFDLPQGAQLLASSKIYENQAFSLGSNVLALQFHAEADSRRIEQWLIGHTCELSAAGIDIPALRAQSQEVGSGLRAAGTRMLADWLEQLSW